MHPFRKFRIHRQNADAQGVSGSAASGSFPVLSLYIRVTFSAAYFYP